MKHIYSKDFKYRPSHATSVEKTWAEARKKLEAEKQRSEALIREVEQKVKPIIRGKIA